MVGWHPMKHYVNLLPRYSVLHEKSSKLYKYMNVKESTIFRLYMKAWLVLFCCREPGNWVKFWSRWPVNQLTNTTILISTLLTVHSQQVCIFLHNINSWIILIKNIYFHYFQLDTHHVKSSSVVQVDSDCCTVAVNCKYLLTWHKFPWSSTSKFRQMAAHLQKL